MDCRQASPADCTSDGGRGTYASGNQVVAMLLISHAFLFPLLPFFVDVLGPQWFSDPPE